MLVIRRVRPSFLLSLLPLFFLSPAASAQSPDLSNTAILATNSVHLRRDVRVEGGVVANAASPGPTLAAGFEVAVDQGARVTGAVKGDSVKLSSTAAVTGTVHFNDLSAAGASVGGTATPLALPVFAALPPFAAAVPRPGAENVPLSPNETKVLPAGDYGDISVPELSTVVFSGGIYNLRSLRSVVINSAASCPFPCRSVTFLAPAEIRVETGIDLDKETYLGPAGGSGIGASHIVLYVGGANGGDGSPGAAPAAFHLGRNSALQANVYAPLGTIQLDQGTATVGSLLARDVRLDRDNLLAVDSAFRNRPPTANPLVVTTAGASPVTITLTGSDPENDDLAFSISSGPSQGSLGSVMQAPAPFPGSPPGCNPDNTPGCIPADPPRTSATVVYTPFTAGNLEDQFTFAVQDPSGGIGMAVVRINPPGEPAPPPPPEETVVAHDLAMETAEELPVLLTLSGGAPAATSLTFAIVSGPGHGSLGPLTQGSEVPQRTAAVTYTPEAGFSGIDSFTFEACGEIASIEVCAQATATLRVFGRLANDQEVETDQNAEVEITLTGTPGAAGGGEGFGLGGVSLRRLVGRAAFLDGAEIAGNVADANGDFLGDNHNALPGSAPVLIAAGVDATGGAGSNGTLRIQIEWDLAELSGLAGSLESASVLLHTTLGTVDSLDTFFFVGTGNQDGLLTDSDFEAPAAAIPDAVMPVPDAPTGTEGTFSFDVTQELLSAIQQDLGFFSIQGRVDEGLIGQGFQRGLQVRSTASSNLASQLEPQLSIATPGVTPPALTFTITSLPANGSLRTSLGAPITAVPTVLSSPLITYTPNESYFGPDSFLFQAEDLFSNVAVATISILVRQVIIDPCVSVGRPIGCTPNN